MFKVYKPPMPFDEIGKQSSLFLAGSIEMGVAQNWQSVVSYALQGENLAILNPRRDEWNSSWSQSISNPQFREQVEWEIAAQERANLIAMYFDPDTKAPITLLELGLFARTGKIIVCCPEGFWRKGNVDIVCAKYGISTVASLKELIEAIRGRLNRPRE